MSRKNIIIVAVSVLAGVSLVLAGLLLFRGISRFNVTKKKLKSSLSVLQGFYDRNPFPSDRNVEVESRNVESLRDWFTTIVAELREGEIEMGQKQPSTFMRLFNDKKAELEDMRTAPNQLPDNFAFGFDRYSNEGDLPAPDDVPRLTQQLTIIGNICAVLFEEKVARIGRVAREEFEASKPGGGQKSGPVPGMPFIPTYGVAGQDSQATLKDAGVLKEGALYAKLHFIFEFEARESTLLKILNRLAALKMFAVVSSLDISKKQSDVQAPKIEDSSTVSEFNIRAGETAAEDETGVESSGAASPSNAPPRPERMVCGPQMENNMSIVMEVDVYRFADPETVK